VVACERFGEYRSASCGEHGDLIADAKRVGIAVVVQI